MLVPGANRLPHSGRQALPTGAFSHVGAGRDLCGVSVIGDRGERVRVGPYSAADEWFHLLQRHPELVCPDLPDHVPVVAGEDWQALQGPGAGGEANLGGVAVPDVHAPRDGRIAGLTI